MYGIVINLNYEERSAETCRLLWEEIKEHMLAAGFRLDGRTFVIKLSAKEACALARRTIDGIEDHLEYHRKHLPTHMKEFYGFPISARTNLLLPDTTTIEVEDFAGDVPRPTPHG